MEGKGKTVKSFSSLKNRNSFLSNSRPSSRGGPDITGHGFSLINLGIDEQTFLTSLKSDVMAVQEEINKLDIDGKLRASAFVSDPLRKPSVTAMKKLLAGSCEVQGKDLFENRAFISPDVEKICEMLRVSSAGEAVKKLFKFLSSFDLFVSKVQELEILTFFQYDELFTDLVEQCSGSNSKLQTMGSSLNSQKLQIFGVNQNRFVELIQYAVRVSRGLKNPSNPSIDFSSISTLEELKNKLSSPAPSLAKLLEEKLQEKLEVKMETPIITAIPARENDNSPDFYTKLVDQLSSSYKELLQDLRRQDEWKSTKIATLEAENSRLASDLTEISSELKRVEREKEEQRIRLSATYRNSKDFDEAFEFALKEEMECMKEGYLALIEKLKIELHEVSRNKGKEIYDLKRELSRETETKNLVLKKLSAYTKII